MLILLFSIGEYFVVGVDIEQYDSSQPSKYLRGMLLEETEYDAVVAFQSYLAVLPSPHVAFDRFTRLVSYIYSSHSEQLTKCFFKWNCSYKMGKYG